MKVNHKTFTGGYKFDNFEGQPSMGLTLFKPVSDVTGPVIEPGRGVTAANVLDALSLTEFTGPNSVLESKKGNISPELVKDIVVNAVEVEPYTLPVENILNKETVDKFMSGLKDTHKSYSVANITIIIGENQNDLHHLLSQEIEKLNWVKLVTITEKYPANFKELAIPVVFNKKYPVGYSATYLGLLYLGVKDILQVAKVVTNNKAVNSTFVALSGPGWKKNQVLDVAVGTPIKDLVHSYLNEGEIRLVKNSILSGELLTEEDIVTFDTEVIIALPEDRKRQTLFFLRGGKDADSFTNSFISRLLPKAGKTVGTNLHGEKRACVSCTYCESVCPMGLIPHLLHKHADKNIINKRLAEYGVFDCIECGLCNYVCPSKIEVLSNIKIAKGKLEQAEISHNDYVTPQCDMITDSKEVKAGE